MQVLEGHLYTRTLQAMDTMLQEMLLGSPRAGAVLQDVLEVLLEYFFFDTAAVQERVMGRIKVLSRFLSDSSIVQTGGEEESGAAGGEIPALGKLLGHLFLKLLRKEESSGTVVEILCSLMTFLSRQKRTKLPEVHAELPAFWEAEIASYLDMPSSWTVQAFGRYLRPAERTDIILTAIEILGRSSLLDKRVPMEFLEVAMKSPELWLVDVPKVVRHIFTYCDEKNATTARCFHALLALMADLWPGLVVTTALEAAPILSDKVCLWEAMFSVRQSLEKVLKELHMKLWDHQKEVFTQQQKSCFAFLAVSHQLKFQNSTWGFLFSTPAPPGLSAASFQMLASGDVLEKKVGSLYKSLNLLRSSRMEMVPLVLRALVTLSEGAETARKMRGLLPELLKFLWHWSWDVSVMAMDTCLNVLGQLRSSEASPVVAKVVQNLWRLFDAEQERVRERSIRLFRELLGKTAWSDGSAVRRNSWNVLVPLVLHMSDQAPGVAKVRPGNSHELGPSL
ncbi:uncharacterized protein LOC111922613 isoform X2 [Cyanistes caeruleus]|uniref:uncharacterized protein LOC111922613 isoform X2 n=1 Tax=Cyanistes caeruleus TaxID=156563 RepID=UPI000CDA01C0|nr:uncharacterized protein LOC111922613 isoform X2 [Cyanistes caeruleus]